MSQKIKPEDLEKIWHGKTQVGGKVKDVEFPKKSGMQAPDMNTLLSKLPVDQPITTKFPVRTTTLIVSPYTTEDIALLPRQLQYAKACVQDSLSRHEAPYCGPLLYSQVINDRQTAEHDAGMLSSLSWLNVCDLVVVYSDYGFTHNMNLIMNQAKMRIKKIEYRLLGKVVGAAW